MFFFCNEGFCKAIVRYIYFFTEGGGSATMDVYIYIYVCAISFEYIYIYVWMYMYMYICIYPSPEKRKKWMAPKKGKQFPKGSLDHIPIDFPGGGMVSSFGEYNQKK